jgi:shikimate dehydrogenase
VRDKLRFAVLGHPISHSVSPSMHKAALKALALPHSYEAIDVIDGEHLRQMVDAVRRGVLAGANVTVPHKRLVLGLVDDVDASAEAIGAANTLVRRDGRVIAYNTDAAGLADDLRALGAPGRTAVIIGAGGAARAAVAACIAIGVRLIGVTTRSWDHTEALVGDERAEQFRALGALPCSWPTPAADKASSSRLSEALRLQWGDIAASSDLVIQASSAGMKGRGGGEAVSAIVPWKRLAKDVLVYDLVYNPSETPFLRAAKEQGLRHAGGLGMLARQGAHALSLWLNVAADVDRMRKAAEKAMGMSPT